MLTEQNRIYPMKYILTLAVAAFAFSACSTTQSHTGTCPHSHAHKGECAKKDDKCCSKTPEKCCDTKKKK